MHRVFISYHHDNDQWYKNELVKFGKDNNIFEDWSVDTGDISDDLTDEQIRVKIRDEYLKESSVTIVLVGTETKHRKHVDWEIYSTASHKGEKEYVFPENTKWCTITEREEFERRYPYMPDRIIDNLLKTGAHVSVIPWNKLNADKLQYMIDRAYEDRANCDYDLSRPMRRRNS